MSFFDTFKGKQFKEEKEALQQEYDEFIKRTNDEKEELKKEYNNLLTLFEKINATNTIGIQKNIKRLEEENNFLKLAEEELIEKVDSLNITIDEKEEQILALDEEILLESFALYKPQFHFLTSFEYKSRLEKIRLKQKQMIKDDTAASYDVFWTLNNKRSEGKKMVLDNVKLILRSFNNECDYCVDNVKFSNAESFIKRIIKSYEVLLKLGKAMDIVISKEYLDSKLEELSLAHEYQMKKQEEKEIEKERRAEIRKQEREQQENKLAQERNTKDLKQTNNSLMEHELRFNKAKSQEEKALIEIEIEKLKNRALELEKKGKFLEYLEKNAKAGYIYIISNLGAFGENVFKIGMTRREIPEERVDELGNASVPFNFDTHALFFQDDAPKVEAEIHAIFSKYKINMMNNRKEFFKVDINEIEKVIREKFKPDIEFRKEYDAEDYRQSIKMSKLL